jgi:Zn-dependent M28 family amino/carboxypeptidase
MWRAMKTVRKLSGGRGIGVRERATRKERRAALLIARKFENLGYKVAIQRFSVDGGVSRNVVARWPGSIDHPLVIGAHIDTVPVSPGANDNASGVATILEAARLAAGKRPVKYIRWIAFGAEEYGDDGTHHDGSAFYVRRLGSKGRRRSPGALSVDMVADGKPLLSGSFGIGPRILGRMVYRRIERGSGVSIEYRTLCDCSDNGPFEHAGIPGAYLHSGTEDPDYHSSTDTPPNLRPKHLKRTGRALLTFVRSVDRATIRTLRRY